LTPFWIFQLTEPVKSTYQQPINGTSIKSDSIQNLLIPGSPPTPTEIDESLGRAAKLVPALEDMYVFKGNWPSGYAAVEGTAVNAAAASGSKGKK